MSKRDLLRKEIAEVPDQFLSEVVDFVRFLKSKDMAGNPTALLSEQILAKDWLRPEEEQAWASL